MEKRGSAPGSGGEPRPGAAAAPRQAGRRASKLRIRLDRPGRLPDWWSALERMLSQGGTELRLSLAGQRYCWPTVDPAARTLLKVAVKHPKLLRALET